MSTWIKCSGSQERAVDGHCPDCASTLLRADGLMKSHKSVGYRLTSRDSQTRDQIKAKYLASRESAAAKTKEFNEERQRKNAALLKEAKEASARHAAALAQKRASASKASRKR